MLFVIDIGNTQIVAGVYQSGRLKKSWRLRTHRDWSQEEMAALLRGFFDQDQISRKAVKGIAVSSVVPSLVEVFEKACWQLFQIKPLFIHAGLKLGISIKTDHPQEVGADRLVNAAAAWQQVKGPVLVLDMGTAITVDVVSGKGEYLGGLIAPGVAISAEALTRRAAKLPQVDLDVPEHAIGKNTVDSIKSGIYYGTLGQVRELLAACSRELGKAKPRILATGGWSSWVPMDKLKVDKVDKELTLKGLKWIYEHNGSPKAKGKKS